MALKKILYFILLFFPFIKTLPNFEESLPKKWNEHSLFDYIKQNFINSNKSENVQNMHYMIVDPNEYLKNLTLENTKNNLDCLFKEFNITSFIFIVYGIEKNTDLDYKLKDFVSELFSEIYKYNSNFDQYSTISILFQIEENEMSIRMGSTCRWVINDLDALKILRKREKELKDKKLDLLLNELSKELLSTYRKNFKIVNNNSGNSIFKKYIIYIMCFILLILLSTLFYCCFCNKINEGKISNNEIIEVDIKSNKEIKIKEFINDHKNKNIKTVMEESCIICLEDYDKENENDINNNVTTSNSDEEDTNNNNNNKDILSNEKVTLPCEHSFHISCISNWFKHEKKCPICKTEYEFFEKREKKGNNKNKLNIKNYNLNKNLEFSDENNFSDHVKDFIRMQKLLNPVDINEEFCIDIIKSHNGNKKGDKYEIAKIDN